MSRRASELYARLRGSKIPEEVSNDIKRIEPHEYRMARIDNKTLKFWTDPYREVSGKLKKRLLEGKENVYEGVETEDLYPLVKNMRLTTHQVYMLAVPRIKIPMDTIRIGKGHAVNHFFDLFPAGVYDDKPNPLNFELVDAKLDPTFNVKVLEKDVDTLREDHVLEMNVRTLNSLFKESTRAQRDLKRRGYRIKSGEQLTFNYTLEGLPGRRKEMPAIPLES